MRAGEERLAGLGRPLEDVAVLSEQVIRGRIGRCRAGLASKQLEEPRRGDRSLRADGRPDEILLEIEELELGGLSDQLGRLLRIRDACELDDDLVRALLAELRLGDAELVDAVPHDVDGAIEIVRRERVSLRRMSLEHDLETALEVEPERRAPVERRAGHGDQGHADERGHDQTNEG